MALEDHPAHNTEAEQAFLGCLLLDDRLLAEIFPALDDDDFYVEQYRQVYRMIRTLAGSGRPVDRAAFVAESMRTGAADIEDLTKQFDRISGSVPHAANGQSYADIIRSKRIERDIMSCHERARGPAREG
ncbi:DnaB-like helicase N-terminal domain-containing protein [Tundrisphaera sp. TA3]|uniref:DnaB-like helicase N-terminal domain-containing protein n=1 Tax=Tundrisphaera sp. TA3 TaxID=3435775 RepID=UPI003EC134E7